MKPFKALYANPRYTDGELSGLVLTMEGETFKEFRKLLQRALNTIDPQSAGAADWIELSDRIEKSLNT
jgi:hypothetical protein